MALIKGAPPGSSAAGADQMKFLGYSLGEWNEIISGIKQLMALKNGGAAGNSPDHAATRPAVFESNPPQLPAAPVRSRADQAIQQIHDSLKIIVDGGGGDAKIFDILQQSGFTVKQVYELLAKVVK